MIICGGAQENADESASVINLYANTVWATCSIDFINWAGRSLGGEQKYGGVAKRAREHAVPIGMSFHGRWTSGWWDEWWW